MTARPSSNGDGWRRSKTPAASPPHTGWLPQHLTLWDDGRARRRLPALRQGPQPGRVRLRPRLGRRRRARRHRLLSRSSWSPCRSRPATGARFLVAPGQPIGEPLSASSATRSRRSARSNGFSSVHVNFCLPRRGRRARRARVRAPQRLPVPMDQPRLAELRRLPRRAFAASGACRCKRERRELVAQGIDDHRRTPATTFPTSSSRRCSASTSRRSTSSTGAAST